MRRDIRSFGIGMHNCFGMNLAKMEMRVMRIRCRWLRGPNIGATTSWEITPLQQRR